MIERHDFNSRWWGAEVGRVTDPALFELAAEERAARLAPWAWAEWQQALDPTACARLFAAGFVQVDTQLDFRIGLGRLPTSDSMERLEVEFADERAFDLPAQELAEFRHERFLALPGATPERVNARYALWAEELVRAHPATCLRVLEGGEVQGWFLARRSEGRETPGRGLELTLAMLTRDARISGHGLYQRALLALGARGHRTGAASFSITNTAVHGIYASLGARFLPPRGCWLWWA